MCDGIREDFDDIWQQDLAWIEEEHARREAEALQPSASVYSYAPQETYVAVEATTSVRQSIKIHHHAPLQAGAILAMLAVGAVTYLGSLLWPYRGLLVALLIVFSVLAALIGLLRLAWPLIVQIHTLRVEQQRFAAPAPHDYPHEYRSQDEQEMYLYQE